MTNFTLALLFNMSTVSNGLPPNLLASLCYVESTYNVNAVHHDDGGSDSLGTCQIKMSTARLMGFQGNAEQLMIPEVNIYYSAKYLSHQIKRYNNVTKAVIAYNMGSTKNYTRTRYSDKVIKEWMKRSKQ